MTKFTNFQIPIATYGEYVVVTSGFDASKPYLVLFTGRDWNNAKGRYSTIEQAKTRARDLARNARKNAE